jgi:hypothetical protein
MEISTGKTKILAFHGKVPIPSKICIYNRTPERANKFPYVDYTLSHQGEAGVSNNITKYTKTMGVISNILKQYLVKGHAQLCLYKALA